MDTAPDVPVDAPMDTPADMGPPRCMSAADCMTNPGRGACDTTTGQCVQCVASNDTCSATEHCNGATNTYEPGCRGDEGCAPTGGPTDGGAAPQNRCDTVNHTCVQCVVNEHCPSGTLCVGSVCVMGCTAERACPSGQTCGTGACVVGACDAPFGDCDRALDNGCEVATTSTVAHCGTCGRTCTFTNAAGGLPRRGVLHGHLQRGLLGLRLQPRQRVRDRRGLRVRKLQRHPARRADGRLHAQRGGHQLERLLRHDQRRRRLDHW
jgi:hypothetical protein